MKKRLPARGLSLIEAVIAVGIFVASMAMIGQLLDTGLRLVSVDKRQTMGLLRAEAMMEEIVAGIHPLDAESSSAGGATGQESVPDREDPRWRTRVVVEPTEVESLARVTVVIEYFDDPESTAEEPDYRQELTRLVLQAPTVVEENPFPTGRQGIGPRAPAESVPSESLSIPEMLGLVPSGVTP